jgi:uncharacterized membrane protein YeaQ/YmgE (transglycosylase-associated protein family)
VSILAFLIFGSALGLLSAYFYPKKRPRRSQFLWYALLGVLISACSSFFGQTFGFFKSGQMLEWISAILATMLVVAIFRALSK